MRQNTQTLVHSIVFPGWKNSHHLLFAVHSTFLGQASLWMDFFCPPLHFPSAASEWALPRPLFCGRSKTVTDIGSWWLTRTKKGNVGVTLASPAAAAHILLARSMESLLVS